MQENSKAPDNTKNNPQLPVQEADRQRQYKKNYMLKKKGLKESTLLDQAKEFLKDHDYDLDLLSNSEQFHKLNGEDYTKLKNFKKNQAKKLKKFEQFQGQSTQHQVSQNHIMAANIINYETEINKLQFVKSMEEKSQLMKSFYESMGTFGFIQFLKSLHESGMIDGIFQILHEIIKDVPDIERQRHLLLQACLFYDNSTVEISQDLIQSVFAEFKFLEQEVQQCLGFLFLLYQNNSTAFSQLNMTQIAELEKDIPMLPIKVCNFLKQFMASPLKSLFPPTLMCLTPPIISEIQAKQGKALFYDVPREFLMEYIEIIAYSFDQSQDNFNYFTEMMQGFFIKYYSKLKYYHFHIALSMVCQVIKRKCQKWLGNLKKVAEFFKVFITDSILSKESLTTEALVEIYLNDDQEQLNKIPDTKLKKEMASDPSQFWTEIYDLNSKNPNFQDFVYENCEKDWAEEFKELLSCANLQILSSPQAFCLSYILNKKDYVFSVVGFGQGKTVLCNLIATHFALTQHKQVVVLNKQKNLSYRSAIEFDNKIGQNKGLQVGFDGSSKNKDYDVVFMCDEELPKYLEETGKDYQHLILIIDEADQILFTEQTYKVKETQLQAWQEKLENYSKAAAIYAFSGTISELEGQCVQEVLNCELVYIPKINSIKSFQNILLKQVEYQQKDEWLSELSQEIVKMHKQIPIIVMIPPLYEKDILRYIHKIDANPKNIQTLIGKDAISINNAIKQSTIFHKEQGYPVYFVDEALNRGLDPQTSSDIEQNGGVYVIVAKIPQSSKSLNQAIARTQRMNKKGQHSIIVWNKEKKPMKQQLEEADEKSQFNIRKLLQTLKQLRKVPKEEIKQQECEEVKKTSEISEVKEIVDKKNFVQNNQQELNKVKEIQQKSKNNQEIPEKFENNQNKQQNTQVEKEKYNEDESDDQEEQNCKGDVAIKPQESTKHLTRKTLGKRKRHQSKTNSPIKQFPKKKRVIKHAQKANKNTLEQDKENKQALVEKKAYVRVNEALKIVIPNNELQEFNEQHSNNNGILVKNQQQKTPNIKAQSSSPRTKRQQALNKQTSILKSHSKIIDEGSFAGQSESDILTQILNDKGKGSSKTEESIVFE